MTLLPLLGKWAPKPAEGKGARPKEDTRRRDGLPGGAAFPIVLCWQRPFKCKGDSAVVTTTRTKIAVLCPRGPGKPGGLPGGGDLYPSRRMTRP